MTEEQLRAELVDLIDELEKLESVHREELGRGFNIFSAAGLVNQEIRHSKILSFLLNPNEAHGLGDYLLRRMVRYSSNNGETYPEKPDSLDAALCNLEDASVRTEVDYGGDRLDILIKSEVSKLLLVIENKVNASQGDKQLERYRTKINNDSSYEEYRKLFVYLAVYEDEPIDDKWWVPLRYEEVVEWLKQAEENSGLHISTDAKVFINHYIDLIERCIMENISSKLAEDIRTVYRKHKAILDLISDNIPSTEAGAMDAFLEKHTDLIVGFRRNKNRFSFQLKEVQDVVPEICPKPWWDQNRPIIFWFLFKESSIYLYMEVGPMPDDQKELRIKLRESLWEAIGAKQRAGAGDQYTKIWKRSASYEPGGDIEEISKVLNQLFEKIYKEEINEKIIESARTIWPANIAN